MKNKLVVRGALYGLVAGVVANILIFIVATNCLSFFLSVQTGPWYCASNVYGVLKYLAFPVNLMTNDLTQAVMYAPLSLLCYGVIGALLGSMSRKTS